MEVIFLQSGESPEIGSFEVAQERDISDHIAKVFIKRGLCKAKRQVAKPKKEVKGDG